MRKSIFGVVLAAMLVLAIGGCGKKASSANYNNNETTAKNYETTKETTEETKTEAKISEPAAKLSDGPVVFNGNRDSFTLSLYSLKTGKKITIFNYDSKNKYQLAIDPADEGNYFHKQLFDSKVERLAVSWYESSDSSQHVGWIDKEGELTDVTNKIHPTTSGFSSKTPNDSWALFTSDDKLIFYDGNEKVYCYYDENSNSITEKYDYEKSAHPDNKVYGHLLVGLDPQNCPTGKFLDCGGTFYHLDNNAAYDHTEGLARDYAVYSDGYVFFEVISGQKPGISHFGPSITEIYSSGSDRKPFYISWDNIVKITPETEYKIENLAYSNNMIVFTASRGTERALYKMSYANRKAGKPELVTNIDRQWGELFFWSDKDVSVNSIYGDDDLTQGTKTTSTTLKKYY